MNFFYTSSSCSMCSVSVILFMCVHFSLSLSLSQVQRDEDVEESRLTSHQDTMTEGMADFIISSLGNNTTEGCSHDCLLLQGWGGEHTPTLEDLQQGKRGTPRAEVIFESPPFPVPMVCVWMRSCCNSSNFETYLQWKKM